MTEHVRATLRFWRYLGGGVWEDTTPGTPGQGAAEAGASGAGAAAGAVAVGEDVSVTALSSYDDADRLWLWRDG